MARIRSMKPEFRTSLTVASWPIPARHYFCLLWGYFDDHGYGVDDARLIKADTFPLDDDITVEVIEEWTAIIAGPTPDGRPGPICRYTVGGRRYLHSRSWTEHQRPSHPGKAKYPPCPLNHDDSYSGESPETLAKPSGDSREDFAKPSGGPREANGTRDAKALVNMLAKSSGDSPENSGDLRETLRPEQVAGSREQGAAARAHTRVRAREDPPRPRDTDNAILAITDATDATESEARQIITSVMRRDDPPRNLPGFLRKLALDGDLVHLLDRVRADNRAANPATHPYDDPDNIGVCQRPALNGQPCGLRDTHSRHRIVGTATVELRTLHAVPSSA